MMKKKIIQDFYNRFAFNGILIFLFKIDYLKVEVLPFGVWLLQMITLSVLFVMYKTRRLPLNVCLVKVR